MNMNGSYSNVDPSDVAQYESLRQSELINRLANRVASHTGYTDTILEREIACWLLDNDMRITPR